MPIIILALVVACGKKKDKKQPYVSNHTECKIKRIYFDDNVINNADSFYRINVEFLGDCRFRQNLKYQWFINNKIDKEEKTKLLTKGKYKKGDKIKVKVSINYNGELIERTSKEIIVGNIKPEINGNDLPNDSLSLPRTLKFNVFVKDKDNDECTIKCLDPIFKLSIDSKSNLITWDLQNYLEIIKKTNQKKNKANVLQNTGENLPPQNVAKEIPDSKSKKINTKHNEKYYFSLPLEISDGTDKVKTAIDFEIIQKDNQYYIKKVIPLPK